MEDLLHKCPYSDKSEQVPSHKVGLPGLTLKIKILIQSYVILLTSRMGSGPQDLRVQSHDFSKRGQGSCSHLFFSTEITPIKNGAYEYPT